MDTVWGCRYYTYHPGYQHPAMTYSTIPVVREKAGVIIAARQSTVLAV